MYAGSKDITLLGASGISATGTRFCRKPAQVQRLQVKSILFTQPFTLFTSPTLRKTKYLLRHIGRLFFLLKAVCYLYAADATSEVLGSHHNRVVCNRLLVDRR